MDEWGIFNDDSTDYTANESVESGFYSKEDADNTIKTRYNIDDNLYSHLIEEEETEEEE